MIRVLGYFLVFMGMGFLQAGSTFAQGMENPRVQASEPTGPTVVLQTFKVKKPLNEAFSAILQMPEFNRPTRDPISGKNYEKVMYGRVKRTLNPVLNYSLWRHVTVYSSRIRHEAISDLPAMHQSCFDGGTYPIGNWQLSRSVSVELRSSLKCGELGLGAEMSASVSEGRTFSMQRALIVQKGIEADYEPQLRQEDWVGMTFIQTYEPSTGELGYIPPNVLDETFGWYPYEFELKNAATVFEVARKNTKPCKKGKPLSTESALPDLVFPLY